MPPPGASRPRRSPPPWSRSCSSPSRWRVPCRPGGRGGCRRSSRSQPARATALAGRRGRPASARPLRLPVVAALGAKDAYVQRVRAVLTVASLALAAAMVVLRARLRGDDGPARRRPGARGQPWDMPVFTEGMAAGARSTGCSPTVPGVDVVGHRYIVLGSLAGGIELEGRVIDGPPEAFAFAVPDGRAVRRAGEVTLGRGALEALDAGSATPSRCPPTAGRSRARVVGRHVEATPTAAAWSRWPAPSRPRRCAAGLDPAAGPRRRCRARRGGDRAAGGGAAVVDRPAESERRRRDCARSSTA